MTRPHGTASITFRRRGSFILIAAYSTLGCLVTTSVSADTVEGFTEPYRHIDVAAASEAGLITEITAREGQSVKRGELLATLDIDVLDAALNVARERTRSHGRIDAAKAEIQVRRSRLEKLKELHVDGHATRGEIERARGQTVGVPGPGVEPRGEHDRVEELRHGDLQGGRRPQDRAREGEGAGGQRGVVTWSAVTWSAQQTA